MHRLLPILFILLAGNHAIAQEFEPYEEGGNEKFASYCMEFHNYREALVEYTALFKTNPENYFYRHQIARCHYHINEDKSKAVPILKELLKNEAYQEPELLYDLGRTYLALDSVALARQAFGEYLQMKPMDNNRLPAALYLQMCRTADSLMKNPLNIKIENAGENINSEYAELFPMTIADESYLLFTARHKQNTGSYITLYGKYNADVWASRFYSEEWRRARHVRGSVNTKYSDYGVCMTSDGKRLLLVFDPEEESRFLVHANRQRRNFERPDPFPEATVNQPNLDINGGWITKTGDFLILSARNKENDVGYDLYTSRLLPNNKWSVPEVMGPDINTPYNDAFPYLTPDEKHLIFASEGHNSMGGYDLVITPFSTDSGHVFNVRNMGYPINSTIDDKSISFAGKMRYAYKSYLRKDGFGNMDIYRLTFVDSLADYSIIRGKITMDTLTQNWRFMLRDSLISRDSLKVISPYNKVKITAVNVTTGEKAGSYKPDYLNGNYNIAVPPGKYRIVVSLPAYLTEEFEIDISDRSNRDKVLIKDIHLKIKDK